MDTSTEPIDLGPGWVIEPRREGLVARLREVWRYRRILGFFAKKSFQKLYKRTSLGKYWIIIRPVLPLVISGSVFGGVLNVGSEGVPYFLFLTIGTATWDLFSQAAIWGTRSLEMNRQFLTRIYLPRLILPISNMAPAVLNFGIHLAIGLCAVGYYKYTTGIFYLTPLNFLWAVAAVLMSLMLALGIGLWTSVPALVTRDVRFTLTYMLGFLQFVTPVLYPLPRTGKYGWLLPLNPMATVVTMFKHGMIGLPAPSWPDIGIALAVMCMLVGSGLWFFGRAEAFAADKA